MTDGLPIHDWQFWTATALAAGALAVALWPSLRRQRDRKCPACPSGATGRPRPERTPLTIGGRASAERATRR